MVVTVDAGRDVAAKIEGAKYVELPGEDHLWFHGDTGAILDEVEVFLTGARSAQTVDRILATVMFTDIVESTRAGRRARRPPLAGSARAPRLAHAPGTRAPPGTRGEDDGRRFPGHLRGPARAIRCACSARDAMRDLGIEVRAGLHTGECELIGEDVGGIAVNIGARVGSAAGPGEVLVSRTVTDLVAGSGIEFADRGVHSLKGVPGEWQLYAVKEC